MKRIFTAALAMLLVLASVLTLASCGSTFGTIKANFEKAGYELVELTESEMETLGDFVSGKIETEEGVITYSIHAFKKSTGLLSGLSLSFVFEFGSDADLMKAVNESETLKGMIKDAQDSDYVYGNCVLFPLNINPNIVEIFNGTYEAK